MDPIRNFITSVLKIAIPNQYVLLIGTGVGWYGRQLTYTFGPIVATKLVHTNVKKHLGNNRFVITFSNYVVAPLFVPQMIKGTAYVVGISSGVITVLVLHTLCYCYGKMSGPKNPPTPPPSVPSNEPKKDEERK